MAETPSKWRKFRREFSRWYDQREHDSDVTEVATPAVPLAPQEHQEFQRLVNDYRSQDPLFDWAEREVNGAAPQPPLFLEGQLLAGRFEIIRFLVRGGMGEVYEATNRTLQGNRVALKTLSAEVRQRPDATRRFIKEVALAQRVTHPNICRIHDIFPFVLTESNGNEVQGHFLTMQLLHGESLAKYIADHGAIPLGEALPILRALAEALAAAHAENVIHRDFKPGNIILVKRSGVLQPIITDFGLAALIDRTPETEAESSLAGFTRAGTPDYSAPEQLKEGRSGPASDVYSLGVVTLEMLTGDTAVAGLSTLPAIPRKAIARCLQADPAARFASAPEFVAALSGQTLNTSATAPTLKRRAVIGSAAALVAGAVLTYFESQRGASHNLNTLSILPFELASPDASLPGFQEELVRAFLRSRKVKLIAPYSTSTLRAPFHIAYLAKILPADGFLLGIISSAAIVVRLFHRNGSQLWERSFPRSSSDFELHRTVVATVLNEIAGTTDARVASTANYVPSEEGYRAYIAARAAVKGQTLRNLEQAESLFLEAIRHDGGFAEAFSGLAYVLFVMAGDRIPASRTAVARALALDDDLAEAHMVKGLILHRCDWQWLEALVEFKKALDLAPYNFAVHQAYGLCLSDRGFFAEGLPEMQTAVDYDPLSYTARFGLGVTSVHARRFDFAIDQLEQGIAVAKAAGVEISRPYSYLGACWLMKGDREKAYRYYQEGLARQPLDPQTLCHFIFGAGQTGRNHEAELKMGHLLGLNPSNLQFFTALAFAGLGHLQRSLDYLEAALEARDTDMVLAKVHLYCQPLQQERRYQTVLQRMRLV